MMRKTMRVGEVRTSIKLETEFWTYLKELADARRMRLSNLVNEIAHSAPDRTNLASTLRTFALAAARSRGQTLEQELAERSLGGGSADLVRVVEATPLPTLLLDGDREIRILNGAFGRWLNLDGRATIGQRVDNIMILRGQPMREVWDHLRDGRLQRAAFTATYVSPGKVRTAQAMAMAVGTEPRNANRHGYVMMFEIFGARS